MAEERWGPGVTAAIRTLSLQVRSFALNSLRVAVEEETSHNLPHSEREGERPTGRILPQCPAWRLYLLHNTHQQFTLQ